MIDKERYFKYLSKHYKESKGTYNQYRRCFENYILKCDEIDQDNIDLFFDIFKSNVQNRAFIKSLIKCYRINTFIDIPKSFTRQKKKLIRYFKLEDIKILRKRLPKRLRLAIRLGWNTGLRISELVNSKKSDYNFKKRTIKGTGKGNKEFKIIFSEKLSNELKEYFETIKGDYPFHYPKVKFKEKKFGYEFKKHCARLGYENVHFHMVRHGLGRYLRKYKGWDIELVRKRLRHESISTTQIYASAEQEDANDKMEELFGGKHNEKN